LYNILPESENPLSIIKNDFDFRNTKSLKRCVESIIPEGKEEAKYYLISLGHGAGFGFFKTEALVTTIEEIPFVEGCSICYKSATDFEILWNIEFFKAFSGIKFELAIFNNCQMTLFENCVLFSRFITYFIATENYLALEMLNLKSMLETLIVRIKVKQSPENIGQIVYDNYLQSILKRISENSLNSDDTSLFYINLENYNDFFHKFEEIIGEILDLVDKNPDWIKEIRNKLPYIEATLPLIDFVEFLKSLQQDNFITISIKKMINDLLDSIEESMISKWARKSRKKLNGISLYFPPTDRLRYDEIYIFNRNLLCSEEILKPSNWDRLLDKVLFNPQNNP